MNAEIGTVAVQFLFWEWNIWFEFSVLVLCSVVQRRNKNDGSDFEDPLVCTDVSRRERRCKGGFLFRISWAWLLGCSDFDFFFTFWGITTHPWHPKGPKIWKLAKKKFQLHPWPAEIFGKNRKMCFFGMISKFNFRSPVWQTFTFF